MDVDDDDAFLYGDQSPPETKAPLPAPAEEPKAPAAAASGLSASMAASLAAYGIDPGQAVAAENPEDGGVEEDDDEEEEDSEDDEDVQFVLSGQASRLDLRKPQQAPSNVIGIGKWAHTSTGQVAPTPQPATKSNAVNQTTEYNPSLRPGSTAANPTDGLSATQINGLTNSTIPPSGDAGTAPNVATDAPSNGVVAPGALPPSSLPVVTVPPGQYRFDPMNPSGIIPSTGNSVYEIDIAQFEGSGQPWRRPGSDLQDYFNFGFDEVSYPKFLRYKQEMEMGRNALMTLPMGGVPPEVAQLLHINMNQGMGFNPQQLQAMQQAMQMQGMQGMPGMGMPGMDPMAMMAAQMMGGGPQQQPQQQQPRQNVRPSATPVPAQATQASQNGLEPGEEVKLEEGQEDPTVPEPAQGGQFSGRGRTPSAVPLTGGRGGAAMRGRGGAIPSGPRAVATGGLPTNIPKGPKAGRFRDKDRVEVAGSNALDYGDDNASNAAAEAMSRSVSVGSPVKSERSRREGREGREGRGQRGRGREYDDESDHSGSRSGSRSTSPSPVRSVRSRSRKADDKSRRDRAGDKSERRSRSDREKERSDRGEKERGERSEPQRERSERTRGERDRGKESRDTSPGTSRKREKRKREEGGAGNAVLGPGGWESEEEESRRRKESSEEEDRYTRKSRRR